VIVWHEAMPRRAGYYNQTPQNDNRSRQIQTLLLQSRRIDITLILLVRDISAKYSHRWFNHLPFSNNNN
jgi:hypothetical protein